MIALLSNRSSSASLSTCIILAVAALGLPAVLAAEPPGFQNPGKQPDQSPALNRSVAVTSPALQQVAATRSITGRAILSGKPPKERAINLDPSCSQLKNAPRSTRFFVTSEDGGFADVFVVVTEGLPARAWQAADKPSRLHISGCFYEPYVSAVRAGQEIQIVNTEAVLHNALVSPNKSKTFNFAVFPNETMSMHINEPELFVPLKCDVHPWEFSYINVVDHPYFAMTDANGNFKLPSLPPGKYKIKAYHRLCGDLTLEVEIGNQEPSPIEFQFRAPTKSFAQSVQPTRAFVVK